MKIFIFSILLFSLPFVNLAQQSNDQRTLSTRIADVLAKFPAANKAQYDANVQQLKTIGNEGLQQMVSMLAAPGKGDNTALEYAISAYSSYVMQPGNQSERKMAISVYCNSLKQVPHDVNRQFLIVQLQLVGNDDALACLQPYLNDEKMSGPAARAIAQINTTAGGKMLLESLTSAPGNNTASIIEALGYVRYTPAVASLQTIYKSVGPGLQKITGYALARIGEPASATILHDAAKKVKFTYDTTASTSNYIQYLRQLAANGKQQQAARAAGQLMTEATAAKQVQARIAALTLMADFNGDKVLPVLYRAMKDDDIEFRAAALQLAGRFKNSATDKQWLNTINAVSMAAKVQIIEYLGKSGDKNLLAPLNQYLNNNIQEIREAAIKAIAMIGQEAAVPALMEVLKKGNKNDIKVVKAALLGIKSDDLGNLITKDLDNMPPASVAAIVEVLAARRSDTAGDKVFGLLINKDTSIRNTALRSLDDVVKQEDLPQLFTILSGEKDGDVVYIQDAVTAATAHITDTDKRTQVINDEMSRVSNEKKYLFIPMLAAIGNKDALKKVDDIYKNGDEKARRATISALSKNSDQLSASMLLKIAQTSGKESAVDGYINIIERSVFPADQKVLMLQEAMALAKNNEQKKKIIRGAAMNRTFLSFILAGQYIDDAALQQNAARALMTIAFSNPDFRGRIVRDLLTKALNVIKGQDSEYEKEATRKQLNDMPPGEGFVPMFNGKDLSGWKGLVEDPIKRSKMTPKALAEAQKKADAKAKEAWIVKDGLLVFTGHGDNLATIKQYGDFEMLVDWKITAEGDAGIYLRGTPQVQIWDTSRRDVGAEVGSGGLYNNQKNASKPLVVADNQIGEWNNFHIIMKGDKVTVYLNGQLVTDNVVLENFWDRNNPIFPKEQIELQAHGTYVAYRNLFIKELTGSVPYQLTDQEKKDNYKILFDGTHLNEWVGNKKDYVIENNELVVRPTEGEGGGNLFTKDEYSDFIFRFEFLLTPGANNGLGIRAPLGGDVAYEGMELQILDNEADIYKDLKPYQYHGSVYGIIPAKRGYLKPTGEWNTEEVIVKGSKIKVILNNEVILDGDIQSARDKGAPDKLNHPGLKREKGHIGFLGHGSVLRFRNIRIKQL